MTGKFRPLGTLSVQRDTAGTGWETDKAVYILCYLALAGLLLVQLGGTISAGIFILFTLVVIFVQPARAVRDVLQFWPLLLLPLLALLSTFWSDAPARTLRAALQLILTFIAAIVICRRISAHHVIGVLFIGFLVQCLVMLPYVPAAIARGTPLVGMFGSKNSMAYTAHMLFALGLAIGCDRQWKGWFRIFGLAVVPFGIALLLLAQSGGSTTSAIITLLTFPIFLIIGRFSGPARVGVAVFSVLMVCALLFALPEIQQLWTDFRVNVLRKDATLTGRTYLWEFASRLSEQRPLLGHGYYAFWRQGNIDAEGLWRWGGIGSRSGFNFHNAFVEARVDLGLVGLTLLAAICVGVAIAGFARLLRQPSVPMAYLVSILGVFYARSFGETGLIAPFSMMTFLMIATVIYATSPLVVAAPPRASRRAMPAYRSI